MALFSFVLIVAGVIGAAYVASLQVEGLDWLLFLGALALTVGGIVLLKRGRHAAATQANHLQTSQNDLTDSLEEIIRGLEAMASQPPGAQNPEAIIDETLRAPLARFAAARQSLRHLYGLDAYADIMTAFAAGERQINRIWSASVDGYGEEAARSLDRARALFAQTREKLAAAAARA